jgi:hypothetical protein
MELGLASCPHRSQGLFVLAAQVASNAFDSDDQARLENVAGSMQSRSHTRSSNGTCP